MAKKASASKPTAPSKGETPLEVPMHSVIHFVKMLHDEGHAEKFVEAAKASKAVMTLHSDAVNFVRDYLISNELHKAMATKVVDPCPGKPFSCNFRD
jgi:predicted dinucleotide-utilizing enzyme